MECNIMEKDQEPANKMRLGARAQIQTMSQSRKMPILVNTINNNFIHRHRQSSSWSPTRLLSWFPVSTIRNNFNLLYAILLFTCFIDSVHSMNDSRINLNKPNSVSNLTRKSVDSLNIYRDKLGLFSHSAAWESTEGYDHTNLFSDVVNVNPRDNLSEHTAASPSRETQALVVSAQSSCVGDCPLSLPLVGKELQRSAEQSSFRPNVLPKWSTIMASRQRNNQNNQDNINSRPDNNNKHQLEQQDPLESSATAQQWRIFKYVHHPDELRSLTGENVTNSAPSSAPSFNATLLSSYEEYKMLSNISSSEEERFFNESLTSTERSLIRNHYFGESKESSGNETKMTSGNDTLGLDAFRPRRSPYRPHWHKDKLYTHREALYQMASPSPNLHPPPPGLAVVQSVVLPQMGPHRALPGSHYQPKPVPPLTTMQDNPSALPVRSVQGFNQFGQLRPPATNTNGGESPEESPSFRLPNFHHPFAKPKPVKMNRPDGRNLPPGSQRRPPPPGRRGRHPPPRGRPQGNGPVPSLMNPPRPIPVPRPAPRPSQGPVRIPASSGGGHGPIYGPHASPLRSPPGPPPIQYSYPKNAENIQDILTYFNAADNEIPGAGGKSNGDPSSPSTGLDAFSNELKEIHGSLLKDIREFAKRPSLLDADTAREQPSKSNSNSIPVPRPSMQSLIDDEDEDEPIRVKPKPARELETYREREREEDREDERDRQRSRDRDRDGEKDDGHTYNYDSPKGYEFKGKRNRKPSYSTSTYKPEDKRHYNREEDEEEADVSEDEERNRRPSSKGRLRIPDREETYSKSRTSSYDQRPSYPPSTKYSQPEDSDERLRPSQNYIQFVQDSRERHRLQQERIRNSGRTKSHRPKSYRSKSKSNKSRRNKYNHQQSQGSHNHNRYPIRDEGFRHRHRQTSEVMPSPTKIPSDMDIAYYKQRNRPVVIKRPYQPYRPVDINKLEKERKKQDQYWNSVSTINLNKARDNAKEQSRKQQIQNHYHYYGVNPSASPSPPPAYEDRKRQAYTPTTMLTSNSSPEEEDVLEIHTGQPAATVPMTTPAYPFPGYDPERDRKAKLQHMYMEYLQRKLEAQAEAQADAMLASSPASLPSTSTHKPKRPMRMKIHIYPNEQVQVVDQNNRAVYRSTPVTPAYVPSVQRTYVPSSAYTNNYYHQRPTQNTAYSSKPYNPPFSYPNSYSNYRNPHHRSSQVPSGTMHVGNGRNFSPPPNNPNPADKNRNVVLHLHVHRRNGVEPDPETGMMMAGSEHAISTAKPLTYEEIYANSGNDNANVQGMPSLDDHFVKGHPGQSDSRHGSGGDNGERKLIEAVDTDKSISMELPIHQDKVEDVLSTLLKLRE